MKPSGLQGLGLFEISQTVDKSLRIIFMTLSLENRHLWAAAPWLKEPFWCLGHRVMARSHQVSDIWTPHLFFSCALIQTVREQLLFSALCRQSQSLSIPREEEMGEDTSLLAFICDKLAALPMTDAPVPGGAKWGRKELEAGVHLLLAAHTPAPHPAQPQRMLNQG